MKQYITFSILLNLLSNKITTAKKLANEYEISKRTVYRYLNELESAGIHTFTKVGKNGGIGIENDIILNSLILTEEEKIYLKNILLSKNDIKCSKLIKKLNL